MPDLHRLVRAVLCNALCTALALLLMQGCAGTEHRARLATGFSDRFELGAVAADHPDASWAGAQVLAAGGNAVDAAVATAFALSVARPMSTGIGGGGFMIIALHDDPEHGRVRTAINFRESAPADAGPDMYERGDTNDARFGGRSVAVPGTVAGLLWAQEQYGLLSRAEVLAPAIELAFDGFHADAFHASAGRATISRIRGLPGGEVRFAALLRRLEAEQRAPTSRLTNEGHARALALLAQDGVSAFKEGPIAEAIVAAVRESGGSLTPADLQAYQPVEVAPLEWTFAGRTLLAMPPPSSGGVTMAQTMGVLGSLPRAESAHPDDVAAAHALAESFRHAFADRARWLADPAFADVPTAWLLDPGRLAPFRARLARGEPAGPAQDYGSAAPPPDDGGTSHHSVVDRWGGAVACTTTINLTYGSLVLVEPFGFVLNDEMDDFQTRRGEANAFGLVQADANLPAPGKRPLSSMSPTIVLDARGSAVAVAGGAGGPRIITATTQALLHALAGHPADVAVASARMHHQWLPDQLELEPGFGGPQLEAELHALGHRVRAMGEGASVQLIAREGDRWHAASDPRKGGRPAGLDP